MTSSIDEVEYPMVWTRSTKRLLWIAIAIVVAAVMAGPALIRGTHASKADDGIATLEEFLDAALAGDRSWTDHAAPELLETFGRANPFRGMESAAGSLDLHLDYSILETRFALEHAPRKSHYLEALVEIGYEFLVDGQKERTTTLQTLWVTRPFFYEGQEHASDWTTSSEDPLRTGPWKVTAYEPAPRDEGPETITTTLGEGPGATTADRRSCEHPMGVLNDVSRTVRRTAQFDPTCTLTSDPGAIADEATQEVVRRSFPFIPLVGNPASGPEQEEPVQDLIGVSADLGPGVQAPVLAQYIVPIQGEEYVATLALTSTLANPTYALIDIVPEG